MLVRKSYFPLSVRWRRIYNVFLRFEDSSRLSNRQFSTMRDAKDYKQYQSRPDDPPKRKPILNKFKLKSAQGASQKTERQDRPSIAKRPVLNPRGDLLEKLNLRLKDLSRPVGTVTCDVKATVEKTVLRKRGPVQTSVVKVTCVNESSKDFKNTAERLEIATPKVLEPTKPELANVEKIPFEESLANTSESKEAPKCVKSEVRVKNESKPEQSLKVEDALQNAKHAADLKAKRIDVTINMPQDVKVNRENFVHSRRHRIYASGLIDTGALGLYKPNKEYRYRIHMARPLRTTFAEETRVITAEAGYGFTLFYVKNDETVKLYGCGLNSEFQLGANEQLVITYPVPVDIRLYSPKTKLLSLSCGRAHSAVATDSEGVFLFGSNTYGQCGRQADGEMANASNDVCRVTQLRSLEGESVSSVVCGQDHTLLLTESGRVFSCGYGGEGQTGLGHGVNVGQPELVEGDILGENIVRAAGRSDTVLALNSKGELFGWGSNEFRQLSSDADLSFVATPVRLLHVNKKCGKIVDIAAGSSFCLVVNEEGDVFVWGQGILGAGPDLSRTFEPFMIPRTLFGCSEYSPNVRTKKVFCGLDHMMAINNRNHVYAWGKNKQGCLGIGVLRDQYFPYKLAISAEAVHASCAVDHSIILANDDLK